MKSESTTMLGKDDSTNDSLQLNHPKKIYPRTEEEISEWLEEYENYFYRPEDFDDGYFEHHPDCPYCLRDREHTRQQHERAIHLFTHDSDQW